MTDQASGTRQDSTVSATGGSHAEAHAIPASRLPRAARLIEQMLRTGGISSSELAAAIVTDQATLDAYRLGRTRMPLERQLCLALVVIERLPAARRAGFALRAQVEAELAVAATRGVTHDQPPISHRWR